MMSSRPDLMRTFGGMQWRIADFLSAILFITLHSAFARWTRLGLGLWRRLGQRLAFDWRLVCGDEALPSALVVDSRSQRSAPTCWARGIDGGKLVKGIKLNVVCDKHGSLVDLELVPANTGDRAAALPMLPRLAELGFQSDLLGDNGYKGAPFELPPGSGGEPAGASCVTTNSTCAPRLLSSVSPCPV